MHGRVRSVDHGHFVALSTLAYPEPLQYLAESRRRMQMLGTVDSSRWDTIGADLMAYWAGESPLTRIRWPDGVGA